MLDLHTRLAMLKRPSLLARAARYGVDDYRRHVHLRRILGQDGLPRSGAALILLLEIEAEINNLRLENAASYRPARHVETLIAILAEAQLLRSAASQATQD